MGVEATDMAIVGAGNNLAIPGEITATGLVLPEDLPYERWVSIGDVLKRMEKSVQWWIGDWLRFGERKYGEMYSQALDVTGYEYSTLANMKWVADRIPFSERSENLSWSHHQQVASLEPGLQIELLDRAEEEGLSVRQLKDEVYNVKYVIDLTDEVIPPPEGKYRCLVIDPPWPVTKIVREVRPNQEPRLDYPTMSLDEIMALDIPNLAEHEQGCHVYLWATQKYLPYAFHLFTHWGVRYECTLTWVKPTGMTPYSWMYNTEHVLFGRIGALKLSRLGLKLGFDAPTTYHSAKPDVFYDRVIAASPGPRLEMFARRQREGFRVWGNEVESYVS